MSTWDQLKTYLGAHDTWHGANGLPHQTLRHLVITLIVVLIAAAIALPLGAALGHLGRGGTALSVLANATRSIPTYGLMVLLAGTAAIGIGDTAAVIALVVFALAPLLTNTNAGIAGVDRDAIEAARGMGMSGGQVLRRVELPLALPLIAAGVRTSAVQTCATATLAAFVGGSGLGTAISQGYGFGPNGKGELVGGAIAVVVVTFALEAVLAVVQSRVSPGARRGLRRRRPVAA